jgi:hypothetical protein
MGGPHCRSMATPERTDQTKWGDPRFGDHGCWRGNEGTEPWVWTGQRALCGVVCRLCVGTFCLQRAVICPYNSRKTAISADLSRMVVSSDRAD